MHTDAFSFLATVSHGDTASASPGCPGMSGAVQQNNQPPDGLPTPQYVIELFLFFSIVLKAEPLKRPPPAAASPILLPIIQSAAQSISADTDLCCLAMRYICELKN